MEYAILDFIQNNLRTPFLDGFFMFVTALGNGGIIWIFLAAVFLIKKETRRMGVMILALLIISTLIGEVFIKNIVCRQRPFVNGSVSEDMLLIPRPAGKYSFPSGHSLTAFACSVGIYMYTREKLNICFIIIAALIAVSRVYLYVHFPTDILAGAVIGSFIGAAAAALIKTNHPRTE